MKFLTASMLASSLLLCQQSHSQQPHLQSAVLITDPVHADITNHVVWTSSDVRVATVNSNGLATAVGPGHALIEASLGGVVSNAALFTVPEPEIFEMAAAGGQEGSGFPVVNKDGKKMYAPDLPILNPNLQGTCTGPACGSGSALPPAAASGQIVTSIAAGTTYTVQGQLVYQKAGDTVASIEANGQCATACTYVVTAPQTITLAANHTLAAGIFVRFEAGGLWTLATTGKVLTFSTPISGTPSQHFAGPGTISFVPTTFSVQSQAPFEWWGVVLDGTTNNLAALQSCINARPSFCMMQNGLYAYSGTLSITNSNVAIEGINNHVAGNSSYLVETSASSDFLDVNGTDRTILKHFSIYRTVLPTGAVKGISLVNATNSTVDDVDTFEGGQGGFYYQGGANNKISNTVATDGAVVTGYTAAHYGYNFNGVQNSIVMYNNIGVDSSASHHFTCANFTDPQDVDSTLLNCAGGAEYQLVVNLTSCGSGNDVHFAQLTADNSDSGNTITGVCSNSIQTGINISDSWFHSSVSVSTINNVGFSSTQFNGGTFTATNANGITVDSASTFMNGSVVLDNVQTSRIAASFNGAATSFVTVGNSYNNQISPRLNGTATNGVLFTGASVNNDTSGLSVSGSITNPIAAGGSPNAPRNILYGTLYIYTAAGIPLPACAGGFNGYEAVVGDATSPTFLGTYTSGGGVESPVICNGSAWLTY